MTLILGRMSTTVLDSPSGPQPMASDVSTGTDQAPSRAVSHYLNNLWVRPFLPCLIFTLPSGNEVCVLHPAYSRFCDGLRRPKVPSGDDWTDNAFVEESGR